jgi:hypothetical protein
VTAVTEKPIKMHLATAKDMVLAKPGPELVPNEPNNFQSGQVARKPCPDWPEVGGGITNHPSPVSRGAVLYFGTTLRCLRPVGLSGVDCERRRPVVQILPYSGVLLCAAPRSQ